MTILSSPAQRLILLSLFCAASLEKPLPSQAEHGAATKLARQSSGLPDADLEKWLRSHKTNKVRAALAEFPKTAQGDEARLIWEGAYLSDDDKYDEAVEKFNRVKQIEGANDYVLSLAAKAYAQMKNVDKAIALSNLAIKRGGGTANYEVRAGCYMLQNRYAEAIADYEKMAQMQPHSAKRFYTFGADAMLRLNKPAQAMVLVDKALQAAHDVDLGLLLTKARCLEKLGRYAEAIKVLGTAAEIGRRANGDAITGPAELSFTRVLEERARCYDALGKKAEAAADRKEAQTFSSKMMDDLVGGAR